MEKSPRNLMRGNVGDFSKLLCKTPASGVLHSSGISTAFCLFSQWISLCIEDTDLVRAESDRYGLVEVFADGHPAISEAAAEALSVDLEDHVFELHRIVAVNDPFALDRENLVEITAVALYKGGAFFAGANREPAVEFGYIFAFKKPVCLLDSFNTSDSQFLRKPSLPGAKRALTAAPCLR